MTAYIKEFRRLLGAWSMWAAGLGIILPDLLQLLADNSDLLPWLDPGYKSLMRLACLVAIVFLRPIKQQSLQEPAERIEPR